MFRWLDGLLVLVIVGSLTLAAADTLGVWDVRQAVRELSSPTETTQAVFGGGDSSRALAEAESAAENGAAPEPAHEPDGPPAPGDAVAPTAPPGSAETDPGTPAATASQAVPETQQGTETASAAASRPATVESASRDEDPDAGAREEAAGASEPSAPQTAEGIGARPDAPPTELAEGGDADTGEVERGRAGQAADSAGRAERRLAGDPTRSGDAAPVEPGQGEELPSAAAAPERPTAGFRPERESGTGATSNAEAPGTAEPPGPETSEAAAREPADDREAGAPDVTAAAAVEPTPQEPAEETPPSPQEPGEQGRPAETGAPAPAEPDSGQEPQSADVGQEPQPEEAEQALASQAVAPGSDAEAHLQLGIYTDEAAAQVAADESSARFRSTLGTNTVRVVPLEREQGTLFRLMSGPYASVGEARNSCGEIVQAGGDCLVVLRGRATSPAAPPTEASAADQASADQVSGDQASGDQASAGVRGPEQAAPAGDQNQPGPGDEQARSFVATPPVGLNYRAGPSVDAARLGALPEGTVVELVSTQDGWARVRLPDGQSAYVDRRFIRPLE